MASKLPLLLLLIAITCLSQFYRVSNSVIAPELTRDLGLSARQLGWAGSAFFFALFAVQIPVGMWFDRYGARRTVAALSILAMAGALWIAAAADAFDLIAARALVGVGCAASFMSVVFLCSRWFPPARLATALSWVFAASNIGTLAAATPLAWIAATVGWRNGFVGLAAVTVVVAVSFYAYRARSAARPARALDQAGEPRRDRPAVCWKCGRTPGLLPVLAMHFFAYATMLTVLGVWGGPYLYDVHKLDGVAARQRAAGHGRGADPGHPGLRAAGPAAALAQEGGAGRRRDLGAAAGHAGPAAAAVARRGGRAAQRLLLLLRLRHGDRGAGPHALSRPSGRPRRHHRQHGAVPGAHRAAGRRRLYRRGVRQFRPCLSRGVRRARGWGWCWAPLSTCARATALLRRLLRDMPRGRRAGRPA